MDAAVRADQTARKLTARPREDAGSISRIDQMHDEQLIDEQMPSPLSPDVVRVSGVCCGPSVASTRRSVARPVLQHRRSLLPCIGGTHQLRTQKSRSAEVTRTDPRGSSCTPSLRGPSAPRRPGRGHRRGRRDRSLANRGGHNTAPSGRPARRSRARRAQWTE